MLTTILNQNGEPSLASILDWSQEEIPVSIDRIVDISNRTLSEESKFLRLAMNPKLLVALLITPTKYVEVHFSMTVDFPTLKVSFLDIPSMEVKLWGEFNEALRKISTEMKTLPKSVEWVHLETWRHNVLQPPPPCL